MSPIEVIGRLKIGVSIGDTLDAWTNTVTGDETIEEMETAWGNPIITEKLVKAYIDNGFEIIRIPVTWRNHIGDGPDYKINEKWMSRIKQVVDYAYRNGAYIILNVHHEDWNEPYYENQEAACDKMRKVWKQIAECFSEYDEHLIFEGQNEPRKIGTDVEWNGGDKEGWDVVEATNTAFVETIRSFDGFNKTRYLMIPGYGANCTEGIRHVTIPDDNHIILSVHAYEPYEFALEMPGRNQWNEDKVKIDSLMSELKDRFLDKGIPVIIGEFGAMNKNGNEEERARWVEYYVSKARQNHIPCVWWDNGRFEGEGELFGLFHRTEYFCTFPKVLEGLKKGAGIQ